MILNYTRIQIQAMVANGLANTNALTHWDICDELKKGKKPEEIAEDLTQRGHKISDRAVRWVRCHKCPDLR